MFVGPLLTLFVMSRSHALGVCMATGNVDLSSSSKSIVAALTSILRRATNGTRRKAVFYYASSSLVCQGIRFLGVLITTRAFAPEQFGLFAQATLVISIAGLFREMGQSGALIAYQGQDIRYVFFNFQMNLCLGSVAPVLLFRVPFAQILMYGNGSNSSKPGTEDKRQKVLLPDRYPLRSDLLSQSSYSFGEKADTRHSSSART